MPLPIKSRTLPMIRDLLVTLILLHGLAGCDSTTPTDAEYMQQAIDYHDQGKQHEAIISLKNAIRVSPENLEARWLLGKYYLETGNSVGARKELTRVMEGGVNDPDLLLQVGEALLMGKEFQDILTVINPKGFTEGSQRGAALLLQGQAYFYLKKYSLAEKAFLAALENKPDSVQAESFLIRVFIAKDEPEIALKWLERSLEKHPQDAELWLLRGNLRISEGHLKEGKKAIQHSLTLKPGWFPATIALAHALHLQGKTAQVQELLETLNNTQRRHPTAVYLLAAAHFSNGDYNDARQQLELLIDAYPDHKRGLLLLSASNYFLDRPEQALIYLNRLSSKIDGYHPLIEKLRTAIQLKLGNPEEAAETGTIANNNTSTDTELLALIATASLSAGNYHDAIISMDQLKDVADAATAARMNRAINLTKAGEIDDAIDILREDAQLFSAHNKISAEGIIENILQRDYDSAIKDARELGEKYPESPLPPSLEGVAYMGQFSATKAKEAFQRSLSLQPGYPTAALSLASLEIQQGQLDKGEELYRQVLENAPKSMHVDTMVLLSKLATRRGNRAEAMDWLAKAEAEDLSYSGHRARVAQRYLDLSEPDKALALLAAEAPTEQDEAISLLTVKAEALLAKSDVDAATKVLDRTLAQNPNSARTHYLLAKARIAQGDTSGAQSSLEQAVKLNPGDIRNQSALIKLYMTTDQLEQAHTAVDALPERQRLQLASLVARLDRAQGNYEKAEAAYRDLLDKTPSSRWALDLAAVQVTSGDTDGAKNTLKDWLITRPSDIKARFALAEVYAASGANDEAIATFRQVLESAPESSSVLNYLAWLLRDQQPDEALTLAKRAYEIAPQSGDIANTLGMLFLNRGNTQSALPLLRKAAETLKDNPGYRYNLAQALSLSGHNGEAIEILTQLLGNTAEFEQRTKAETLLGQLKPVP